MRALGVFAFILLAAQPAWALKISPFKAGLPMNDPSATQVFYVENNTDEPAAVQVSAETWAMDSAGVETNASAEQDFVIFPAQVVLKPHESRAVRVQYVGTPAAQEKA